MTHTINVFGNATGTNDGVLRFQYDERAYDFVSSDYFTQSSTANDQTTLQKPGDLIALTPNQSKTAQVVLEYNPSGSVDTVSANWNNVVVVTAQFDGTGASGGAPFSKISKLGPLTFRPVSGNVTANTFLHQKQPLILKGDWNIDPYTSNYPLDLNVPYILVDNAAAINVRGDAINGNAILKIRPFGTTQYRTVVEGCDEMWKGFRAQNRGVIELGDITVRDAQIAVQVEGGTAGGELKASGVAFEDNNFGTVFQAGARLQSSLLQNNSFRSNGAFLPFYAGQSPLPFQSKGFCAVHLAGNGSGAPLNLNGGNVSGLHYGTINGNGTVLNINGTAFRDLSGGNVAPDDYHGFLGGSGGLYLTGIGAYASGGQLTASGGDFVNCFMGVSTTRTNTTVQNTQMDNVTAGVVALQPTALTAKNNAIRTLSLGINSAASDGLFNQIQGNDIQVGESKDGIGINVAVTGSAAPRIALVANNTVNMVGGTAGIQLSTPTQLAALANTVSIGQKMVGIKLEGGNRNTLRCNTVGLLPGGSGPTGAMGLYAIHPAGGAVNCNTTNDVATGLSFEGVLSAGEYAAISGNTLRNHNTGLAYGASTVTGPQVHQGNRWEGTFSVGAVHGNPFLAGDSRYIVDILEDPNFMPPSIFPASWFEDVPDPNPSYQCPTNPCPLPPAGQTGQTTQSSQLSYQMQVAQGTAASGDFAEANNWLAQRRLYQQIASNNDPAFSNFVAQSQNNGLAAYANVQTALSQMMQISEEDAHALDSLSQAMDTKSAQILALEEQLMQWEINPVDSAVWAAQKATLGESAGNDYATYTIKWANIQATRTAVASSLLSQNTALPGTAAYQVNEKAVNEVFLQTVAVGVVMPTTAQKGILEAIAAQCPLYGGEAVLRARTLLVALGATPLVYDDEALCFPALYPSEDRATKGAQPPGLWVFPNPTSALLNVAWYSETSGQKTFALYDVYGRLIKEARMDDAAGSIQVDVAGLPNGVYVYHVKGKHHLLYTGKVSVQH